MGGEAMPVFKTKVYDDGKKLLISLRFMGQDWGVPCELHEGKLSPEIFITAMTNLTNQYRLLLIGPTQVRPSFFQGSSYE